jgi:hypothetical protein
MLPDACDQCRPYGGNYRIVEKTLKSGLSVSGAGRCVCARGKALGAREAEARTVGPPILTFAQLTLCVEMLAAMGYFPTESGARMAIGNEIGRMCRSFEDAVWLAQRMIQLYPAWPGALDMRLVYCSRRRPLDGIVPTQLGTEAYPEGIPSETPTPVESPLKALPAGHVVSADPDLEAAVRNLASKMLK